MANPAVPSIETMKRAASRGPVALALGSNLGHREEMLSMAKARLCAGWRVRILRASSIYETQPVECRTQPWFLNQVLWVETDFPPVMLLSHCQGVEAALGRRRAECRGPRTMDIDILFYEDRVITTPVLTLPHPALARRRSILQPLAELGIAWRHPTLNADIAGLLAACSDQGRVALVLPGVSGVGL